jgi:hypothetical protein
LPENDWIQLRGYLREIGFMVHPITANSEFGSVLGFDWARRNPERVAAIAYTEGIVRPLQSWNPELTLSFGRDKDLSVDAKAAFGRLDNLYKEPPCRIGWRLNGAEDHIGDAFNQGAPLLKRQHACWNRKLHQRGTIISAWWCVCQRSRRDG